MKFIVMATLVLVLSASAGCISTKRSSPEKVDSSFVGGGVNWVEADLAAEAMAMVRTCKNTLMIRNATLGLTLQNIRIAGNIQSERVGTNAYFTPISLLPGKRVVLEFEHGRRDGEPVVVQVDVCDSAGRIIETQSRVFYTMVPIDPNQNSVFLGEWSVDVKKLRGGRPFYESREIIQG